MKITKQKDSRYPIKVTLSDGRHFQVVKQSKLKKKTFLRQSGCSIISAYEALQWLGRYDMYPLHLLKWAREHIPKFIRGKLTIRGVGVLINKLGKGLGTAKYYKPNDITLDKVKKFLRAGSIILFEHKAPHTFMLVYDNKKFWLVDKGKCRKANLPVLVARKNKTKTYGGMVVVTAKKKQ